jgi:uncharacterized SAM-binding protein YcdF (DUF218 family)
VFRGIGLISLAAFLIITMTPLVNAVGIKFTVPSRREPADAIVVLGAGLMNGGSLGDESMRRAITGIELYRTGLAPILVFSGPGRTENPPITEAEQRSSLAQQMGIPPEAILREETAKTTREEAVHISRVLSHRGLKRILLVTESLHLLRSKLVFENAGLEVFAVASDNYSVASVSPGDRLWLAGRILKESAALTYYRLAGYI